MPSGLWTRMRPRKGVLHGGAHWRHLAHMTELSFFRRRCGLLSNYFDHLLLAYCMSFVIKQTAANESIVCIILKKRNCVHVYWYCPLYTFFQLVGSRLPFVMAHHLAQRWLAASLRSKPSVPTRGLVYRSIFSFPGPISAASALSVTRQTDCTHRWTRVRLLLLLPLLLCRTASVEWRIDDARRPHTLLVSLISRTIRMIRAV